MPNFSKTSQQRLNTCHENLQRVFNEVIKNYDCTILVGYRTPEEQANCYKTGKSKLKYGHHNNFPATAVDVSPWPISKEWGAKDWKERAKFYYFAGFVKATAQSMDIKLRWGGDWNDNKDFSDQTFDDLVHFELV